MGDLHKLYYKIGEVARIVEVEPHVLRYWEQSFRAIRPHKSPKGHRVYTKANVELLLRIKELVHDRKFTIAGAKKVLRDGAADLPDLTEPSLPSSPAASSSQAASDPNEGAAPTSQSGPLASPAAQPTLDRGPLLAMLQAIRGEARAMLEVAARFEERLRQA
jgi:DNA-binding transcriptional MerR regulator